MPIKKSVTDDYIICLEDGKKLKMLKRHLMTAYNMTPEEYRARWGLKPDYPMVAPNYAAKRQELAKKIGLGRKPRRAVSGGSGPALARRAASRLERHARPEGSACLRFSGSGDDSAAEKKLFVKTYGCQMNVYDSERMAAALARAGLRAGGEAGGRRPGPAQHLPHPREGGGEGLFRDRAAPAAEGASEPGAC